MQNCKIEFVSVTTELTHIWTQDKTRQNAIPCCRNWIGNLNQQNEWKLKREGSLGKGIRLKHRNLGMKPSQREGDWSVILLRFNTFTRFLCIFSRIFYSFIRICVCIIPTPLLTVAYFVPYSSLCYCHLVNFLGWPSILVPTQLAYPFNGCTVFHWLDIEVFSDPLLVWVCFYSPCSGISLVL